MKWTQWYMFQSKELSETPNTPGSVTVCRPGKRDFVLSLVLKHYLAKKKKILFLNLDFRFQEIYFSPQISGV